MEDRILFVRVNVTPQVEDCVQVGGIFLPLRYEALWQLDQRLQLVLDPETAVANNLGPDDRLQILDILFRKIPLQEDLAQKSHETRIIQELLQLDIFEGLPQEKLTFCPIVRLEANRLEDVRGLPIGFGHSLQKWCVQPIVARKMGIDEEWPERIRNITLFEYLVGHVLEIANFHYEIEYQL